MRLPEAAHRCDPSGSTNNRVTHPSQRTPAMSNVDTASPQPNVIVVPPGGGGGGLLSRLAGTIIASCLISSIGYFAGYTTLFARLWLKREGAIVEMPAEKKPRGSVVERGRDVLGDSIARIREQLGKTKKTAAGGFDKAMETGAKLGKAAKRKADKKAEELKQMLAKRQEESKKKKEEQAELLAEQKAHYDEQVRKYYEFYDGQCPNPRCHAPLRTKGNVATKYVSCARCHARFTAGRARALGPPRLPPFRPAGQSFFGKLFGH